MPSLSYCNRPWLGDIPDPVLYKLCQTNNQFCILNVEVEWSGLIPSLSYFRLVRSHKR